MTGGVEKLSRAGLAISGGDMETPCPLGIHMPSADWLLAIVSPEERWQGHSCLEPALEAVSNSTLFLASICGFTSSSWEIHIITCPASGLDHLLLGQSDQPPGDKTQPEESLRNRNPALPVLILKKPS